MSINKIIDAIIEAEGGRKFTDDPHDSGGRTQYGISERAHPEAWADNQVTEDEARDIYLNKYVIKPGFDKLNDENLKHAMVDYGVNSGPVVAIRSLQRTLGVPVDGILGSNTLNEANSRDPRVVVAGVVAERVKMIGRIVVNNPTQLRFLMGWLNRALEFLK